MNCRSAQSGLICSSEHCNVTCTISVLIVNLLANSRQQMMANVVLRVTQPRAENLSGQILQSLQRSSQQQPNRHSPHFPSHLNPRLPAGSASSPWMTHHPLHSHPQREFESTFLADVQTLNVHVGRRRKSGLGSQWELRNEGENKEAVQYMQ